MQGVSLGKRQWLIVLLALTILPRLALAIVNREAFVGDVPLMVTWSQAGLTHDLVGSPWLAYAQLAGAVADSTALPFPFLMKLLAIAGDVLLTAALFLWTGSVRWTLFFALNPVAILVSAGLGHIDTLTLLPVLWSFSFLRREQYGRAGLLGGLGIVLKFYPVFFVGLIGLYLLRWRKASWRKVVLYGLSTAGVYFLWLVLVFLVSGNERVFVDLFDYAFSGSNTDLGLLQLLHTIGVPIRGMGDAALPGIWGEWFSRGKLLFGLKLVFGVWTLFTVIRFRFEQAMDALIYFLVSFYLLLGGTGMEYLVWIVPFGFYQQRRDVAWFTLASFPALSGFILYKYPDFIVGSGIPFQPFWQTAAAITNAVFVIFVTGWFLYETRRYWLAARGEAQAGPAAAAQPEFPA